jgi:hypothetical protein
MSNSPIPRDRIKALINGVAEEIWHRTMDASEKFGTLDVIEDVIDLLKELDLSDEEAWRTLARPFLQRVAKGVDRLLEPHRAALAFPEHPEHIAEMDGGGAPLLRIASGIKHSAHASVSGGNVADAGQGGLPAAGRQAPGALQSPALSLGDYKGLEDVFDRTHTHNPNVIAAAFAVEQAKAQVKLAEGSLLPEVDLVGNSSRAYGQSVTVPGREDTSQALVNLKRILAQVTRARANTGTWDMCKLL